LAQRCGQTALTNRLGSVSVQDMNVGGAVGALLDRSRGQGEDEDVALIVTGAVIERTAAGEEEQSTAWVSNRGSAPPW
jgi:hypothetical protein